MSKHATLAASVSCDGQQFEVAALILRERIHFLTEAHVELALKHNIDFAPLIGKAWQLRLHDGPETLRSWTLLLAEGGYSHLGNDSVRYRLTFRPLPWLMSHTLNTRKYRNLSAQAIITKVLDENGIAHRWEITGSTETRKYTTQYRESNLDFVLRLLEFEGIFYTIDADGTLVLDDRSLNAEAIDGNANLDLIEGSQSLLRAPGILRARRGARVQSGKATVSDFNWKTPRVSLLRSAGASRDSELETYDYPAGYRKPAQGKRIAQLRLEAHRTHARFLDGTSNVPQLTPNRTFSFNGPWPGQYLLCSIEHRFIDERFRDDDRDDAPLLRGDYAYENDFHAISADVPFRPQLTVERPTVQGCHTAMVRGPSGEEIYTDKYGRFRAQFHWDREAVGSDEDSRWLRKLQETQTSMNLARIGWEVSVAYIDGDPDRPIGLARNINGVMTPTYGQPGAKEVMTIHTPSSPASGGYNEIKLDDKAGSQLFYVQAERDQSHLVENDRNTTIGNNNTEHFHMDRKSRVKRDQSLQVGADRTVTIKVSDDHSTQGDRTRTVGGHDSLEADTFNRTVQGDDVETVGGNKFTTAGVINIPSAQSLGSIAGGGFSISSLGKGAIFRSSEERLTRTIGGIQAIVSGGSITRDTKLALFETIGGAKVTIAATGSIQQSVQGPMAFTVGGAVFRLADDQMGVAAENCQVNVGAMASLKSAERTAIDGRTITLTALASLTLVHGDTEITLLPNQITIKGDLDLDAGEKVVMAGKDDNLSA